MTSTRRNPINYTVYTCSRCPNGRGFDILQISTTGKNAQRSLQYHVTHVHPDHQGDWRELVGQKIIRARGRRAVNTQRAAGNAVMLPNIAPALSLSPTRPRLQPIPAPTPTTTPINELEGPSGHPNQNKDLDCSEFDIDDIGINYSLITQAQLARSKASKILQQLQDGGKATIGMDEWDQAAANGLLGKSIHELAKSAFPADMFDHEFTVCLTSNESVVRNSARFYMEKASRLESRARNQAA